jgi:hypothetical protein
MKFRALADSAFLFPATQVLRGARVFHVCLLIQNVSVSVWMVYLLVSVVRLSLLRAAGMAANAFEL